MKKPSCSWALHNMNNNNLPGQIISELGQIAKDVGKQVVQVPKDIAGKALESLGTSSKTSASDDTAWAQIGREKDQNIKQSVARKALEELVAGKITKPREPSIWERLQQEQEQKKNMLKQQSMPGGMTPLVKSSSKRPVGDLYGAKAKSTATENRNVRQD